MINLLPKERKLDIKKEYYTKLLILGLVSVCSVVFIFGGLLISFSFIIKADLKALETQILNEEIDPNIDENKKIIETLKVDIKTLSLPGNGLFPTHIIDTITKHDKTGIHINDIAISLTELNISGLADERDNFILFIQSLESEPLFLSVNSPISSLSKVKDINFQIRIKLVEEEV